MGVLLLDEAILWSVCLSITSLIKIKHYFQNNYIVYSFGGDDGVLA